LGPRLRGDDVMMSPNALALNAFIDSLERGCRENVYSIHQSSLLDWESGQCIYWVPASAGTTDFVFHVAKTAFCDSRLRGNDERYVVDFMSMRYCLAAIVQRSGPAAHILHPV
ncbi:MAG: hypothetical protein JXX14_17535, partial [Deltaproteobacteria bacterium]|nr:hypothetical protein [Deltaproteobacteria bacterium]